MFYYSWTLAAVATMTIAVAAGVTFFGGWIQLQVERPLNELRGKLSGRVLQLINGVARFRVSATESRAFATWAADFSEQRRLTNRARIIANRIAVFNAAFPVLACAAIFFFAAQPMLTTGHTLGTGSFMAFQAAFLQTLMCVIELSACTLAVMSVVPLYERARPILTALPEEAAAQNQVPELDGRLELSHVSFRYKPDRPLILDDISLSVRAGEFVAFVGPSGCGKSTLFRLLLGFERPESGSISYDGLELSTLDAAAVRRQAGVVLQNSTLFSGDIFTNIVGSMLLTLDDAWEAARMSGLDTDIEAMPMGMHTMVGEGGAGLSGGQRQRLMIARALVHRPRILLLDEATSALDNQTQAIVSQALDRLRATRLVIAHRLSTVMRADRIVVLEKGRIVQQGRYEELLGVPGMFQELAKRQLM
jgi:ATP-binding cassette subfamily C protein